VPNCKSFLLQRLKESTSGDAQRFQHRDASCHQVFFLQGKEPKEIHTILRETIGEHSPTYATLKNWVTQFKRGEFSTCGAPSPGRRKTVTTPEIIDQKRELILDDSRISVKSIAEQLGISGERVGYIIHKDLDMRKLSAKWVTKCLEADQKVNGASLLGNFRIFWRDLNDFLLLLVTMDKTWLYHYDPETKKQSMKWWHSISPRLKISECKNPLENFSPQFFFVIRTASSLLIIFQRAKLSTRSITHLCWCN